LRRGYTISPETTRMNPLSWTLLAPLAAGAEVVAYRAQLGDGTPVEVRTFSTSQDLVKWPRQQRRLRLAQILQHPSARAVLDLRLEDPPALVLAWSEATPLRQALAGRLPLPTVGAVAIAVELAALLRAAHRLGLAHGDLSPDTVCKGVSSLVEVDFTPSPNDTRSRYLSDSASGPAADDIAALAALLCWMLTGELCQESKDIPANLPAPLLGLLADMLTRSTSDRLPITKVAARLEEIADLFDSQDNLASTRVAVNREEVPSPSAGEMRERLGRFRILEKIGSGGMGEVYRAEDAADGSIVAVKTLLPEFARKADMLQRFVKEARLLAEVRDPHVARLLEVNEDDGQHYLAVEFVSGPSLAGLVAKGRALPERLALTIASDICHALVAVHERGILHRDIKPDNILLAYDPFGQENLPPGPLAKLSDFGLARHLDQSESMSLTRTGTILGTPLYLSPEQCTGADLDARTDIYSLGATLFHLLTGRPPFLGDSPLTLINHHCNTPAPSPRALVPSLSEGTCRMVEKMLAKRPDHRYGSAGELLRDIEAFLGGKPSSVGAHPRLPDGDPTRVLCYDFEWQLTASPRELWPYVSNTERLNRAIHLPAVDWTIAPDDTGRVWRQGLLRKLGLEIIWEEHPFEWVEGRRLGVLREFKSGPFRWFVSIVELTPSPGGGTTLTHRLRIEPFGIIGRTFAALEMGNKTRRKLDRVYRRIDEVLRHKAGAGLVDAFEEPARLSGAAQRRLDEGLDALARHAIDPHVVEQLGAYLATAPAQEVSRIRPIALARRLGLDAEEVCNACLHATRAGLLTLSWDLLCPLCRIPSQLEDTLKAVRDHAHCPACAVDFEVDFSRSVEMIFRVHPSIREAETGTYCIGGPAHSPHVVAQVRVAAGERLELPLELAEGAYRLRGPQLPSAVDARVERGLYPSRWEVDLGRLESAQVVVLRVGAQMLALANTHHQELVVRLERTAPRDDALTAARAASMALFRELFPGEVLGPGQLVSVSTITLLATELAGIRGLAERDGENRAFDVLHEHLRQVDSLARRHGGALLKAVGDGAIAAFHEPAGAVRVALELACPAEADLRLAVHRGPALAATINDRLDYFGGSVRHLVGILRATQPGERLFDKALLDDVSISALLGRQAKEGTLRWIEAVGGYAVVVVV
jgi:eukaryotic-like serine/threonine-protein kinase